MVQIGPAAETALFINWYSPGMDCDAFRDDRAKREEDSFIGMTQSAATAREGQSRKVT
jgi:hypothetical protein